jgi:hypothetical protein
MRQSRSHCHGSPLLARALRRLVVAYWSHLRPPQRELGPAGGAPGTASTTPNGHTAPKNPYALGSRQPQSNPRLRFATRLVDNDAPERRGRPVLASSKSIVA